MCKGNGNGKLKEKKLIKAGDIVIVAKRRVHRLPLLVKMAIRILLAGQMLNISMYKRYRFRKLSAFALLSMTEALGS